LSRVAFVEEAVYSIALATISAAWNGHRSP
jgi:hypothetical protein